MQSLMNSPAEIAKNMAVIGYMKGNIRFLRLLPLGILAGVFIAIGALSSSLLKFATDNPAGLAATISGAIFFTIGIVLVILAGGELFTGNMLMVLAVWKEDMEIYKLIRNWFWVYIFNFVGAVIVFFVCYHTGMFDKELSNFMISIAESKIHLKFTNALFKGIGCNVLVCLSVWIAASAKSTMGKILSSSFPVMIFIILQFEHSVANMFFLPTGYFLGANFTISEMILNNLLPVTIGNIIGGVAIATLYHLAFTCCYKRFPKPRGYQ